MIALEKNYSKDLPFKEQLKVLSKPGLFLEYLIVRKNDGSLGEINLISLLWEKLKGFFGLRDWSHPRLIELKVIQFLSAGKNEVQSPKEIQRMKLLAWKAGLTQDNKQNHLELNALVNEICNPLLQGEKDLVRSFAARYSDDLRPFPQKILKIEEAFKKSLVQPAQLETKGKIQNPRSGSSSTVSAKEEVKQTKKLDLDLTEKEFLSEKGLEEDEEYLEEDQEYLEEDEEYLEEDEEYLEEDQDYLEEDEGYLEEDQS